MQRDKFLPSRDETRIGRYLKKENELQVLLFLQTTLPFAPMWSG